MTIAVFNFANDSLDIVHADTAYISDLYGGDVERYLCEDLCYDPDNICFMSDVRQINFTDNDSLNQIR